MAISYLVPVESWDQSMGLPQKTSPVDCDDAILGTTEVKTPKIDATM